MTTTSRHVLFLIGLALGIALGLFAFSGILVGNHATDPRGACLALSVQVSYHDPQPQCP